MVEDSWRWFIRKYVRCHANSAEEAREFIAEQPALDYLEFLQILKINDENGDFFVVPADVVLCLEDEIKEQLLLEVSRY